MNNNPFNITFGKEPSSIISRTQELEEVFNSFASSSPNSQVYILTGIRGAGKTVAMTTVSDHYKTMPNWITVELNPESEMLEQLASKLYDEGKLKKLFLKTDFSFSFTGIGLSISGDEPVTNVSTLLKKEFEYLKKKGQRVLITIDEAVSNRHMKVFAHEFQTFLRADYDVCLLMTGLYQNISLLEKQKSLTFLYRAPKIYLSKLNLMAISNSYRKIFEISENESIKLARYTNGYAYAYQLLGNILFKNKKKELDESSIDEFDENLFSRAYSIIYSELTEKEKQILQAALQANDNESIINAIGIDRTQLSSYKKKLILKGVLSENRSSVEFSLPRFDQFLRFVQAYSNGD